MYSENDTSSGDNSLIKRVNYLGMRYQTILDRLNGKPMVRWGIFSGLFLLYLLRIFIWGGWYIVTYALGIYYLNLLIAFLSPQVDPEAENDYDAYDDELSSGSLGSNRNFKKGGSSFGASGRSDEEFRPFIRRLPEFKFWYSTTRAAVIALFFTTSRAFDIPVYYPILLGYFVILFVLTMRKQIQHMIKYKYVPFTVGKKSYKPSATGPTVASTLGASVIPQSTGGLLNSSTLSAPPMTTTSMNYSPSTGSSTAYQLQKPGFQAYSLPVQTTAYPGFQSTVTPFSASTTMGPSAPVKTGKKD